MSVDDGENNDPNLTDNGNQEPAEDQCVSEAVDMTDADGEPVGEPNSNGSESAEPEALTDNAEGKESIATNGEKNPVELDLDRHEQTGSAGSEKADVDNGCQAAHGEKLAEHEAIVGELNGSKDHEEATERIEAVAADNANAEASFTTVEASHEERLP